MGLSSPGQLDLPGNPPLREKSSWSTVSGEKWRGLTASLERTFVVQQEYLVLFSGEDAWVELMLNPLEGVLSGVVSSCSAGQRIVTIEAADSAVSCLVPMKTP
uniref:Uncharacterized protein n=1 Tax=Rangifer tarandus platyrhynchus TaxID=3082113 RepID=A0ACB0E8H2_RANTA|nr:unnamed protein product [Rangifer tarandus platyrhynchus]